jgi:hypothetical protein
MGKRIRHVALLGLVVVLTSGCFLRALLGTEVVESLSEEVDRFIDSVFAEATTAVCTPESEFGQRVECVYIIEGEEVASTTSLISELGLFGVFIDPLVLELPIAAAKITGAFDDGAGHSGPLVIYPKLSFVPVDDTRKLVAGPGKQLVIADLPAGVPVDGVTYSYALDFEQTVPAGTGPTPIKVLLTGKLTVNGKTFYPPMLPCTTDLAALPAMTLPRSATLEPLVLPQGLTGCTNQNYFYFRAESEQVGSCDLDHDHDVDRNDLNLIMAVRNTGAAAGDPRDTNNDGRINANDSRACALRCTRPGCRA